MKEHEFARSIRAHDWSACMSDSASVARRGSARRAMLAGIAKLSGNHARLWELGSRHHGNFTWENWATESRADPVLLEKLLPTREQVHETAWRWVASYLWVNGIRDSDVSSLSKDFTTVEEASKSFVGALDGHRDWYGERQSTARQVDWTSVDSWVTIFRQNNTSGLA